MPYFTSFNHFQCLILQETAIRHALFYMICIFAKVPLVAYFIRIERDELAISSF